MAVDKLSQVLIYRKSLILKLLAAGNLNKNEKNENDFG